ncbi:hypothetical protein ACFX13_039215 [Malus domestica]
MAPPLSSVLACSPVASSMPPGQRRSDVRTMATALWTLLRLHRHTRHSAWLAYPGPKPSPSPQKACSLSWTCPCVPNPTCQQQAHAVCWALTSPCPACPHLLLLGLACPNLNPVSVGLSGPTQGHLSLGLHMCPIFGPKPPALVTGLPKPLGPRPNKPAAIPAWPTPMSFFDMMPIFYIFTL